MTERTTKNNTIDNSDDREHSLKKSNSPIATSSGHGGGGGVSSARILGSAIAGISELSLFHPVDTIAKRLMSTETRIVVNSASATALNLNAAVFRESSHATNPLHKFGSLFPGIGFGAVYKICQRVYKFGGQPLMREKLTTSLYGQQMKERFGSQTGTTLISATAGSIIGIGEVFLLPLDALKVKAQTAPEQLKGRGVVDIFRKEGWGLYRGAGWTVARNAPGSFALFGGNSMAKSYMGVSEDHPATWSEDALASCAGAVASITVAQPLDVVKTRIQNRPFDSPEGGMSIVSKLIKNEGAGGFFKGLTPKLMVVGPKLVFSFTIAQHTIAYFTNKFSH
eukprot:50052_1